MTEQLSMPWKKVRLRDIRKFGQGHSLRRQVCRFSQQGSAVDDTLNLSAQELSFLGCVSNDTATTPDIFQKTCFPLTSTPAALLSLSVTVLTLSCLMSAPSFPSLS